MTESQELLAQYVQTGSDAAFRELVTRYIDLVYSVALRLVEGDMHRAEDVSQIVFTNLARLAPALPRDVMLGGWLHRDSCFVAANLMRSERRRRSRERQAMEMNALQDNPNADFSRIAPILDEAINQLGEADRTAILLRFFEQCDFRSVGEALGSNEDAARMRVNRALEKLQSMLKQQGLTTSAAALVLALALPGNLVQAVPPGLALSVSTAAALGGTTAAVTTTATAMKATAMTALQKTFVTATLVAAVAAPLVMQYQKMKLREENDALRRQTEQLAVLAAENERLSNELSQMNRFQSLPNDQFSELLRLRGEVGKLRRETQELERLRAAANQPPQTSDDPTALPELPSFKAWETGTYLSSEEWVDAGLDTPENALQTLYWV
jgi:RNA polymerase sigma factor (sigma-70 family)